MKKTFSPPFPYFTYTVLFAALTFIISSCDPEETPVDDQDTFDRETMLINWADNIIIPAYENYSSKLDDLSEAKDVFIQNPDQTSLQVIRTEWLNAYSAWQYVSMFEIGKAEQITLRDFTNIFPVNPVKIEDAIQAGDYNLELPSSRDQQGFPAIDYLLHGSGQNDQEILTKLREENYANYLSDVVDRVKTLGQSVLEDWKSGYRDDFVGNNGSSANSSVNKLVNDYMFYYEKALRAGKIGIPAGVFSSNPLSDRVEALYANVSSKVLFETAFQATIDFFNGKHYNSSTVGESLNSYLDHVGATSEGEQLSSRINDQFASAQAESSNLSDSFVEQIESDNMAMLSTYDELQKNVVLLKVDMFQALNIQVDFVDADGD